MNHLGSPAGVPARPGRRGWLAVPALLALALPLGAAEEKKTGRLLSADASVLARASFNKPWQILKQNQELPADHLLVGMPGAVLEAPSKAVTLTFLTDLDVRSPRPSLESAVIVHPAGKFDMDFTLDRGRVDLVNNKAQGSASVRVRFREVVWELTLETPGTRVALELFGRWPAGTRFDPDPKNKAEPLTQFVLLVVKGEVNRKCPKCLHHLKAPPGPAVFMWDNVGGQDLDVQRLEKLPEWAKPEDSNSALAKAKRQRIEQFRKAILEKGVDDAIKADLATENPLDRRMGVIAAGALDRLVLLGEALRSTKHLDSWDYVVLVLRHWMGRGPNQARLLYERLISERGMNKVHARIVLQGLMGFTEDQELQPETYSALIGYLNHKELAIRGLAKWHLERLVPHANIAYNPAAEEKERLKAIEAWRKFIPEGKLPPPLPKQQQSSKPSAP